MDERTQSTMSSPAAAKLIASQLETALKALAKLFVTIRFYPAGHPSLKDVTSDAKLAFENLLQTRESVVVTVRRTGFYYEDEPVGSANAMLQKLSASLFARKVPSLMILKDLSCRDLWETAKIILLDADVIQKNGGIQTLLQQALVTTIWTNAVDIKGIFELKKQIEEKKTNLYGVSELAEEEFLASLGEPSAAAGVNALEAADDAMSVEATPQAGELLFEELLKAVEMATDDQEFSGLLQRLLSVLQDNLNEKSTHLVLQTLFFLVHCAESSPAGPLKRKAAQQAMAQLSSPLFLNFYIDILCSRVRIDANKSTWDKINQSFGVPLAKLLLTRLVDEEEPSGKRVLAEALISQGSLALGPIFATLEEDRWTVLRTAIYLLGEIRDVTAIDPLRPLLRHRDLRVRRETLRALTRIGGNSVIAVVAKILQGDDSELCRQAMLCLGAIKNPATVPVLVQFLQVRDWRFLLLEVKLDAVRALGEIGSVDALPALIEITGNRCLFYRSRNDELRAAALLAIGMIGGSEAIQFLEIMEHTSSPIVAKAANNALKQARKGHRHDG